MLVGGLLVADSWASSDEEPDPALAFTSPSPPVGKKGKKGKKNSAPPPPDPALIKVKCARRQRKRFWRAAAEELQVRASEPHLNHLTRERVSLRTREKLCGGWCWLPFHFTALAAEYREPLDQPLVIGSVLLPVASVPSIQPNSDD